MLNYQLYPKIVLNETYDPLNLPDKLYSDKKSKLKKNLKKIQHWKM